MWPRRGYKGLYRHGGAFLKHGLWDMRQLSLGPEITERSTPESLGPFLEVPERLTLGRIRRTEMRSECDADRRSHRTARQNLVDLALQRIPMGDNQERERVFTCGFLT